MRKLKQAVFEQQMVTSGNEAVSCRKCQDATAFVLESVLPLKDDLPEFPGKTTAH